MDLAAHLGMTVKRLQAEMSLRELLLWRMKWNSDPWGEYREDLRVALVCATLVNINLDLRKVKPVKLEKFILFPRAAAEEPEEARQRGPKVDPGLITWLDAMAAMTTAKAAVKSAKPKGKKPNGN